MHVSGTEQFRQFPAVLGALPQKVPGAVPGGPPPKGFGQFRAVSGSGFGQFRASTQILDLKRNPFAPKSFGQFRAV